MKIEKQVCSIIKKIRPNVPDFELDTNLQQIEVLDSVAMMEFVVWIEETFELIIDTDDLTPENFSTLRGIVAYIEMNVSRR